mmetsp:Transcript_37402/g.78884  ORF Transcript_37402/g.78884 Transcript_37402/m.78884 type:complete len:477 (+) Transcript_37402:53-1483(+)
MPATDYYPTLESYRGLWDSHWRNMFQNGTWASGQLCSTASNHRDDCFHPYACITCKHGPFTNTKVFYCAGCRVVKYCCREHQRADWASHKAWCKAFNAVKKCNDEMFNELIHPEDTEAWMRVSKVFTSRVMTSAGVRLHTTDSQLVACQPRCRRCLVAGLSSEIDLITCPKCHGVALCKDCHKVGDAFHGTDKYGRLECENYQISQACTGMVVEQGSALYIASNTDVRKCFQPKDWVEYFDRNKGDFELPGMLLKMAPVVALIADGLSLPLTILHVLGLPAVLPEKQVSKLDRLIVHLVGASAQEAFGIEKYIELVRLIPSLTYLRIVLIGPDLNDVQDSPLNIADPGSIKIRRGCNAQLSMRKGLYQNVIKGLEEPPTLVLASHPGMFDGHYTESWRPTVELLSSQDVPFVVTGYNEQEVLNDRQHLEEFGARVVVEPTANPFRGLRPMPDPSRECSDFIFGNSHFLVTRGGSSP